MLLGLIKSLDLFGELIHERYLYNPKGVPNEYQDHEKFPNYEEHILRVLQRRNIKTHEYRFMNKKTLAVIFNSAMIVFLYAAYKHKDDINRYCIENESEFDLNQYLKDIIKDYEKRTTFKFVPLKWRRKNNHSRKATMDSFFEDMEKGNKGDLYHAMLLGDAGKGKSTSIEYLEYKDAINYIQNDGGPIPIRIKMGGLPADFRSIESEICRQLGMPEKYVRTLLKHNNPHIFIDAIDEVRGILGKKLRSEIERFREENKHIFIIISNRDSEEKITRTPPLRDYELKDMDLEDINFFISEQFDNKNDLSINKLEEFFEKNNSLINKITPYKLWKIINIAKSNPDFELNIEHLTKQYLNAIIIRERTEKDKFLPHQNILELFLAYLALKMNNSTLSLTQTLSTFARCNNDIGTAIDSNECLELFCQLGILKKADGVISFSEIDYLNNYLALADDEKMGDLIDD
jgi:hypothetical protein